MPFGSPLDKDLAVGIRGGQLRLLGYAKLHICGQWLLTFHAVSKLRRCLNLLSNPRSPLSGHRSKLRKGRSRSVRHDFISYIRLTCLVSERVVSRRLCGESLAV